MTGLITLGDENSFNKKLPIEIANLKEFNAEDINSYENYKKFAQSFNDIVIILNNQKIFNIPKMEISSEGHERILKFIIEYGPLVNNYNEIIESAKIYNMTRFNNDLEYFYSKTSNFALELILINSAVFYAPSYNTVGKVYRASGLQVLAPKCGGCISIALSTSHWTMRNGLVELSSQFSQTITEKPKRKWDSISIESLKIRGSNYLEKTKDFIGNITNTTVTTINNFNSTKAKENIINVTNSGVNKVKYWWNNNFR